VITPSNYNTSVQSTVGVRIIGVPICPDLLDYSAIGAADNWRGRVVRAFFWLMRAWPT
jgi:hypothetical protein